MRVPLDCSTIGGSARDVALAVQEAIVSHSVGLYLPSAGASESRSSHLNCVNS